MQLSIIIVNFRTFDLTINCIRSILKFTQNINYEIILIDNAPLEDNELGFKAVFPNLVYEKTSNNVGFGKANNIGIALAKGKYILLLNSDTVFIDESVQSCVAFMEEPQNAKVGLLGCKLLNEDLTYQPSFYPFLKSSLWNFFKGDNPILFKLFKVNKLYQEPNSIIQVGDVSGAFMFLRREVIEKLNAFDPDFFLYFEETEWCKVRILKFYQIVYFPACRVIHFGGKSSPKSFLFVQHHLSQALYWYKEGIIKYSGYVLYRYLNLFFLFVLYLLGKDRSYFKQYLKAYFYLIPYLFFNIPKYSPKFGSRPEPLIFEKAKAIFLK